MTIATCYTFWGLCREAISFYCTALYFKIDKLVTYGDRNELGLLLNPEQKELIHDAVLLHPSGCRLIMCDSITLLLSQDSIGTINAGHLSQYGCRSGAPFQVSGLSEDEITHLYKMFVDNQSIVHIPLGPKNNMKLYADIMDKYNLNWVLLCD